MRKPSVKTAGGYTRRLRPLSCAVSLSLQPLSTVNLTLPADEQINVCDWVEVETPDGETGYYRVQSISTDAQDGTQAVYLEHGACTLGDVLVPDGATKKDTIENILSFILGQQVSGQDVAWDIGTVDATDTIYVDIGGMSPMDAITTMMQSIPDYQAVFRQESASDWFVDIVARPTVATCEGRLSRNLLSCDISYNAQGIVTRIYANGLQGGYMDSANTAVYGIRAETQSLNDGLSAAQKTAIISSYLRNHDHPTVSISISAVELSQITGLAIDQLKVGTVCRIAIPWLNITESEVIIDKRWSDIFAEPERVSITLANATPDLSIAIAAITGGGGGGLAGRVQKSEEAKKRFETKFEQSDEYFRLLATETEWDAMGQGTVTAYSQITQTATSINQVVSAVGDNGQVTAASIALAINETGSNAYINADHIYLTGTTTLDGFASVLGAMSIVGGDLEVEYEVAAPDFMIRLPDESYNSVAEMLEELYGFDPIVTIDLTGPTNNVYTLSWTSASGEKDGSETFSRATTLNGAWDRGTYTVTASPQGETESTTLYGLVIDGSASQSTSTKTVSASYYIYDQEIVEGQSRPNSSTGKRVTVTLPADEIWQDGYDSAPSGGNCDLSNFSSIVNQGGTTPRPSGVYLSSISNLISSLRNQPYGGYITFTGNPGNKTYVISVG